MNAFWEFILLGLGLAPAYILLGQSVVLAYRGSNVVNFASAGLAFVAAFGYYGATRLGLPTGVALIVGVITGGVLGATIDLLVMRKLANARQLSRVIATLGIGTIITVGIDVAIGNGAAPLPPMLFGDSRLVIFGASASSYRLAACAIGLILTAVLWAVYKWSRFGLQTAAVAENQRATAALGHRPRRISLLNWTFAGMLCAVGGIMVTPLITLDGNSAVLLMLPALAAALIGSFSSFWLCALGGLLIGLAESELTHYSAVWGLGPGWEVVAPFAVVVLVLMLRGGSLPDRGHLIQRLPRTGTGRVRPTLVVPMTVVGVVAIALLPTAGAGAVTETAGTAIILMSFVVITGYTGQISLSQAGLAGIGAFAAARLGDALGLGFWPALGIGILVTVPIGALFGLPALRARGVHLAILTLGLGLIVEDVLLGNPAYVGGTSGLAAPSPSLFGYALDGFNHPSRYATMTLLAFTLVALAVANLRRGQMGRRLIAVRGNERAAVSLGIGLTATKLYAFMLAAGIAALGGILLAFQSPYVLFQGFDITTSITLLAFIVVGGVGYVGGAVAGSLLATGGLIAWVVSLITTSSQINNLLAVMGGVAVVATVILFPDGAVARLAASSGARLDRLRSGKPARIDAAPATPLRKRVRATVLEVKGLSVRFGGVSALQDVALEVRSGEIVGLIGPNGAGKTTMIDAISGHNRHYHGTVRLDGVAIDSWSAARRARSGVVRSFQSLELFDDLSVEDNLRVAAESHRRRRYVTDLVRPGREPLPSAALAAVREFRLEPDLRSRPDELPYGRRRLVAVARAAAADASILLLDEPAAGLDEAESRELTELLLKLATEWNLGILLVEHDMGLVMSACDKLVVLDFGRRIAIGSTEDVRKDPDVIAAYLGQPERTAAVSAAVTEQR